VWSPLGHVGNLELFKHPVNLQQPTNSPQLNVCAERLASNAFLLGCLVL